MVMVPMKKNKAGGVITFHTPFSVSSLELQECTVDVKDNTDTRESVLLPRQRPKSTSECVSSDTTEKQSPRPKLRPKQDCVSHTSLRQPQAKMEVENQQGRKIIKPLLDTENALLKEFEVFLSQWDATQLKRKELLHKRWTDRVWLPLQRRLEDHVSSCSLAEAKRRQTLYSQFLHHCNIKGYVFLETYDPKEYNPFLLSIKKSYKLNIENIKEPLYLQLHERLMQRRITPCEAGCKYTIRHIKKLPQSDRPQATTPLQVSFSYPASAPSETPVEDETQGRELSRLDTIPYHVTSTATESGMCHRATCWFSRCGCLQEPATLQLLTGLPTFK
ncbi:hypothetical protein Q5P01_005067 [Channa striata]|uniref:Protein FAM228B n=1 Tax=Channa striata TaxID=64152 RepID=A0AA88T6Z5_CHASR|nr:hypothetical protein Q5P01_005067 [Channa striata]